MDSVIMAAMADEIEKIAQSMQHFESAIQQAGGKMTPAAYQAGHAAWENQQALKKALAPRKAAYLASKGRLAKKAVKPGLLKRLFRAAA